jgi:hypothetical protein
MRKLLSILSAELLVALLLGQWGFLHRKDFDRAFFAHLKNPTPETGLELDKQNRINEVHRLAISAVAFSGMATVTFIALHAYGRRPGVTPSIQH